ncbi:MAG: hypothetical protein O9320_01035 [Magnetospirillum sp.]|jgi:hypothetical protein|nr:hypothetical protein [Magnetospirillum sp.]
MDETVEPIDIRLVVADPARARLVDEALDGSGSRIVDDLAAKRVKPFLDVAIARSLRASAPQTRLGGCARIARSAQDRRSRQGHPHGEQRLE